MREVTGEEIEEAAGDLPRRAGHRVGRLRVAFVCPFDLARLSGTPLRSRVTIEVVARLGDLYTVYVLAIGGVRWPGDVLEDLWEPRPGRFPRFRLDRLASSALRRLRIFAPDVIHAVGAGVLPALLYKARHRGVRVVFEMHGLAWHEMRNAPWPARLLFGTVDCAGARFADRIIGMSYTQRDVLVRRLGVRPDKTHVIWGPVDVELFRYVPPPPSPPLRVGYSGNDSFWQGLDTVFEAARRLSDQSDIEFRVAGFDPAGHERMRPARLELAGVLDREATAKFLGQCHVLLSTRVGGAVSNTQYPHKLSAYLAAGRPVIASDVNDQARILREANCGRVVPAGDAGALAEAIVAFEEMPETTRLRMGLNARRFAEEHCSLGRLAERLERVYTGHP